MAMGSRNITKEKGQSVSNIRKRTEMYMRR
jgi:hypothetical protein